MKPLPPRDPNDYDDIKRRVWERFEERLHLQRIAQFLQEDSEPEALAPVTKTFSLWHRHRRIIQIAAALLVTILSVWWIGSDPLRPGEPQGPNLVAENRSGEAGENSPDAIQEQEERENLARGTGESESANRSNADGSVLLQCRLENREGHPVPVQARFIQVELLDGNNDPTTLSKSKQFTIENIAPHRFLLRLLPGVVQAHHKSVRLRINGLADTRHFTQLLTESSMQELVWQHTGSHAVSGRILGPNGLAMADARVQLVSQERWDLLELTKGAAYFPNLDCLATTTATDGSFLCFSDREGEHRLMVSYPGLIPKIIPLGNLPVTELQIPATQLEAGRSATLQIRDQNGNSVSGALLWIQIQDSLDWPFVRGALGHDASYWIYSNPSGNVTLTGISEDSKVRIQPDGYLENSLSLPLRPLRHNERVQTGRFYHRTDGVTLRNLNFEGSEPQRNVNIGSEEFSDPTPLEITLGFLDVILVDADNTPMPDGEVAIAVEQGSHRDWTPTSLNGEALFLVHPEVEYSIRGRDAQKSLTDVQSIRYESGSTRKSATLSFAEPGFVEIRLAVVDSLNQPQAGARWQYVESSDNTPVAQELTPVAGGNANQYILSLRPGKNMIRILPATTAIPGQPRILGHRVLELDLVANGQPHELGNVVLPRGVPIRIEVNTHETNPDLSEQDKFAQQIGFTLKMTKDQQPEVEFDLLNLQRIYPSAERGDLDNWVWELRTGEWWMSRSIYPPFESGSYQLRGQLKNGQFGVATFEIRDRNNLEEKTIAINPVE